MFETRFREWRWQLMSSLAGLLGVMCTEASLKAEPLTNPPSPMDLPRVQIPKLSGSVMIDGELQEQLWKQAAIIPGFRPNDGNANSDSATELRLWYNDDALFLGWRCHDQSILATMTNRDDRLWNQDVVEFFITPGELGRYFEFQWSPLGTVFDAVVTNRCDESGNSSGYQFEPTFNAVGLKSAVKITRPSSAPGDLTTWNVEAMVPFADLNQTTPKPGDVWRGNFFRIDHGTNQPAEASSWSPTRSPQFHHPNRFGSIVFGE